MLASARGHRPPTVGRRAATRHRAGVSELSRILASLESIPERTAVRAQKRAVSAGQATLVSGETWAPHRSGPNTS
jgi:hypothetical protein